MDNGEEVHGKELIRREYTWRGVYTKGGLYEEKYIQKKVFLYARVGK